MLLIAFHPSFLKKSKDILSYHLAEIIEISIVQGEFPDELMVACAVPIFKSGDKSEINKNVLL